VCAVEICHLSIFALQDFSAPRFYGESDRFLHEPFVNPTFVFLLESKDGGSTSFPLLFSLSYGVSMTKSSYAMAAKVMATLFAILVLVGTGISLRKRLLQKPVDAELKVPISLEGMKTLKLSESARKNLRIVSKPVKPEVYWRSIQIPGVITDRPGLSDRGVISPAVGAVAEVHAFPGDTVRPGDRLFTLRLFSEYLQNTQAELFKATRELSLIAEQKSRLDSGVQSGAISATRLIELENQAKRQAAAIQGFRQDLLTRGLTPIQIEGVSEGRFVSTIEVAAPAARILQIPPANQNEVTSTRNTFVRYEVQELRVELGQQVQAGQLLSMLSDHQNLYIEGFAFKREATLLSEVAEKNLPIQAEFADDDGTSWRAVDQTLTIRHLANSIEPNSRTLSFFVPLQNQSRKYEKEGQEFSVWRFRPGQRVRLRVPIEEMKNVIVVPSAAVVREGPEAFVFQQNGDLFNRIAVNVLHQDRLGVVLANDGSVTPGLFLANNAAAALNRVLKAQAASGIRADIHVHADGTTHAAH
jgi:cobalt-zinc-cadmium efflux system membrane fusion protein